MLGQMDRQLLPRWEGLATEAARLLLRSLLCLNVTLFNLLPGRIAATRPLHGSLGLDLRLRELVFPHKMLQEVVATVTSMAAFLHVAGPPLQVSMALILVADPISLPLEDLGISALVPCTGEGLHILVYVLGPV